MAKSEVPYLDELHVSAVVYKSYKPCPEERYFTIAFNICEPLNRLSVDKFDTILFTCSYIDNC